MSSDPSRPDSPIPDLDLEVGDWSGSEKDLASRPVETVVTTRGAGDSERGAFADTEHDVKEEAAENVNMGGTTLSSCSWMATHTSEQWGPIEQQPRVASNLDSIVGEYQISSRY